MLRLVRQDARQELGEVCGCVCGRVGWLVIDEHPKIVYNLNTTLMEVIRLRGRLQHNTPEHDGQGLADAGLPRDPRQPQEQDDAHDVLECRHKHP